MSFKVAVIPKATTTRDKIRAILNDVNPTEQPNFLEKSKAKIIQAVRKTDLFLDWIKVTNIIMNIFFNARLHFFLEQLG